MKLMISKCLLGYNCKYNGGNNYNELVKKIYEKNNCILICPEVFGGLKIPHEPSEIKGDRVISKLGIDVTDKFNKGAEKCLELALKNNVKIAILKESSPSCGVNNIYDGTFSNCKIPGMGITAKKLFDAGVKLYSEKDDLNDLDL